MSKAVNSSASELNEIQVNNKQAARARSDSADARSAVVEAPGVVIPGERLSESQITDGSESFALEIHGKRVKAIAHPIPSASSPGYAAITDYLNCSFKFKYDSFKLANFFNDLAEIAGEQFRFILNRGKGMNGYESSYELGHDGAKFCCVAWLRQLRMKSVTIE